MNDSVVFTPMDAAGQPIEKGPGQSLPILNRWNPRPANLAREMVRRHGRPQEITDSCLVWRGVVPFSRIVVRVDEFVHEFPETHLDCLEHVVPYPVPLEAVAPLYEFSRAIVVDRSAQEILARCSSEEANILHLNIAHYVIVERWDPAKAREYLQEKLNEMKRGLVLAVTSRLVFSA